MEDGQTRIQCRFEGETVWLTQKLMAELFRKDVRTINEHIQNVLAESELPPESVIRKFRITAGLQTIQNKLHFAVTGKTAPELIAERADSNQPNMGLTAWKSGVVRKGDVTIAKNYLREEEIDELNRIVVMFLDFAEDQARRRRQIFLQTWQSRLDDFLRLNERAILPGAFFAARRRARLEDEAAADTFRQLEDAAKKLPEAQRRES